MAYVTEGKHADRSVLECILRMSARNSQFRFEELALTIATITPDDLRGHIISLTEQGLLTFSDDRITVGNRLNLAEELMKAGFSVERVSELLSWREFERFSRRALEEHGFTVRSNLRFSQSGRRYEIDIVGAKEPYMLFVDCKHWRPGHTASFKEASRKQRERMNAAFKAAAVPWLKNNHLQSIRRLPILVSLADADIRIVDETPVVPIFRLNNFLLGLDEFWEELSAEAAGPGT